MNKRRLAKEIVISLIYLGKYLLRKRKFKNKEESFKKIVDPEGSGRLIFISTGKHIET